MSATQGPESGDTCFVCLEGGNLHKSHCECQILAHPECLLKCINSKKSLECTVCKTSYANIYFEVVTSRQPSNTFLIILFSAFVVIFTSVGAGAVFSTNADQWPGDELQKTLRDFILFLFCLLIMGSLFVFFKFIKEFKLEGANYCIETHISKARYSVVDSVSEELNL
jgi:hypothetical protein